MKEWGLMKLRREKRAILMGVTLALDMRLGVHLFEPMLRMILIVANVAVVAVRHFHCARPVHILQSLRL